jgi:probable phosphoglycerate mutase
MANQRTLVLIRHGEAEHHVRGITGGWTDTHLTNKGVEQSALLGARLRQELDGSWVQLRSSSLSRAVQTATILGDALNAKPAIDPGLVDMNNGLAAGKTHAQAKELAIPPSEPLLDWQPYPQAESWRQFYNRVSQFMEGISARQERITLLVTHSATIHVIIAWWLGLPVESKTHFDVDPASLTVLKHSKWGEHAIERMNDTAHLYVQGIPDPLQL